MRRNHIPTQALPRRLLLLATAGLLLLGGALWRLGSSAKAEVGGFAAAPPADILPLIALRRGLTAGGMPVPVAD